jgi:hypothetical protein
MMNKTNLILDLGIFAGLLVAAAPGLTGLALHEWLSVAFFGTIVAHLLLHWKWIVSVGAQFFRKLFHSSRLQFVVDVLLFVAFITVMTSGLVISRNVLAFLGIAGVANNPVWRQLHSLSANLTILAAGLHFALHWDWVVGMVKRYILKPVLSLFGSRKQPASVPVEASKAVH